MGIYVNPGNEEFKRAANSKIYVDKTMLLAFTNQNLKSEHQNICVSRPRRFGKSMAANMLSAYYGVENDSHALFKPYRISKDSSFDKLPEITADIKLKRTLDGRGRLMYETREDGTYFYYLYECVLF